MRELSTELNFRRSTCIPWVIRGYFRNRKDSAEGQICRESIRQGVIAASEMGVPSVIFDGMRMNNPAKKAHVFEVAKYAVALGESMGFKLEWRQT